MLVKTETIVLKSMKYSETSKIVTFYSREYGKIKGIAKGARTAKNKFGSALEPFSYSLLLIYKKEQTDLHLISQCDSVKVWKNLTKEYDRMMTGLEILKLMNKVTHHEERSPELFHLLAEALQALNDSTRNYETYGMAFQLKLASLFGYTPSLEFCGVCNAPVSSGEKEGKVYFQIPNGIVACTSCLTSNHRNAQERDSGGSSIALTYSGLQVIRQMLHTPFSSIGTIEYSRQTGNEIGGLIRLYIQYHLNDMKRY